MILAVRYGQKNKNQKIRRRYVLKQRTRFVCELSQVLLRSGVMLFWISSFDFFRWSGKILNGAAPTRRGEQRQTAALRCHNNTDTKCVPRSRIYSSCSPSPWLVPCPNARARWQKWPSATSWPWVTTRFVCLPEFLCVARLSLRR